MRTKTTNTRGKKSNAKTNHLKDVTSNSFDMKEKETCENQFVTKKRKRIIDHNESSNEVIIQNSTNSPYKNEEKLNKRVKTTDQTNYQIFNCSINLEDMMKTQGKYHEPVEKTSKNLDHTKPNNNSSFKVHNQMESAENQLKPKTNTPSKSTIKNKDANYNTKIKRKKLEDKQRTETIVKNSPNLSDKNEGRLPEYGYSKGVIKKKTKRNSFIDVSNGPIEKKTKSISKTHYLKNISNIIEMKEKGTCENQFVTKKSKKMIDQIKSSNKAIIQNSSNLLNKNEEKHNESTVTPKTTKQKTYQIFNCSVNLEDMMKTQVKYHEPVEKTSEKLDHAKPNTNSSFEVHNQMESAENQLKPKTNTPSKSTIKNKDANYNTKIKRKKLEDKQRTETIVKNSPNLSDKNEGRLPEYGYSKGVIKKKSIGVSNGPSEKKTKSITKSQYLKNISNIIETKDKETCENQLVTKKSKRMIDQIKSSNEAITQNSSNLLHNIGEKLNESAKSEVINEASNRIQSTIVTTVKMRRRRPSIMIRAYYQDSSNSNL